MSSLRKRGSCRPTEIPDQVGNDNKRDSMQLIDSHAHIQSDLFGHEIDAVVQRSKEAGIIAVVNIGTSLRESQECLELAEKYPDYLVPTIGLHPEDAVNDIKGANLDELRQRFVQLAKNPKTVAIGECGLDFGKGGEVVTEPQKDLQRQVFQMQVEVARELKLPLIVHCRNAWEDTFSLLSQISLITPIILHSFTGNTEIAQEAVTCGYYISFSGIVTFSNAKDIQEAAKIVPAEKMLVETDSPFLAPEPMRGGKNEPKNVRLTAQFLSDLRGIPQKDLASKTVENTNKVFNLPPQTWQPHNLMLYFKALPPLIAEVFFWVIRPI